MKAKERISTWIVTRCLVRKTKPSRDSAFAVTAKGNSDTNTRAVICLSHVGNTIKKLLGGMMLAMETPSIWTVMTLMSVANPFWMH